MVPVDGWHRQPPEHVTVADNVSVNRYFPASQSVHSEEPSLPPNFPAGHVLHSVSATAPAAPYLPIIQLVHMSVPDAILNFPAAHCKLGPPLGPVDPALHVQSVTDVLPGAEFELGAHVKQLDAPAELYVPTEQRVQSSSASWLPAALATSALYLPAGQFVQDEVPIFVEILPAAQTTQPCNGSDA